MKTRTHTQPVECREYFGDNGGQLGAVLTYRHAGQTRHVVEVHDFHRDGVAYFPVAGGVFDGLAEAADVIERNAREAQAPPDTVRDPLLAILDEVEGA